MSCLSRGTLNTFAKYTNVDTQARIIDYDIRELGEQLMPLGMLVTLGRHLQPGYSEPERGKRTWIVADEFYILFRYEYSANFFYKLWKRIRKYNGLITGLTQNVDELLRSDTARLMLANSEFLILLNQSATDREELAKLLHISDTQLGYITDVPRRLRPDPLRRATSAFHQRLPIQHRSLPPDEHPPWRDAELTMQRPNKNRGPPGQPSCFYRH